MQASGAAAHMQGGGGLDAVLGHRTLDGLSTLAPAASRALTTDSCKFHTAMSSGVWPSCRSRSLGVVDPQGYVQISYPGHARINDEGDTTRGTSPKMRAN